MPGLAQDLSRRQMPAPRLRAAQADAKWRMQQYQALYVVC